MDERWLSLLPMDTQKKFRDDNSLPSELVLRCFSLLDAFGASSPNDKIGGDNSFVYRPTFSNFFSEYAHLMSSFKRSEVTERVDLFERALSLISQLPEKDKIFYYDSLNNENRRTRTTFNGNLIEIFILGIMEALRKGIDLDVTEIERGIAAFKADPNNINGIVRVSLSDIASVQERVNTGLGLFAR